MFSRTTSLYEYNSEKIPLFVANYPMEGMITQKFFVKNFIDAVQYPDKGQISLQSVVQRSGGLTSLPKNLSEICNDFDIFLISAPLS
jgi:hypothetical protein